MSGKADEMIRGLYPDMLRIEDMEQSETGIRINLRSTTHAALCPDCGCEATEYHSTYTRRLQDLPILGMPVRLHIHAYRYYCKNPECARIVFAEDSDGLASSHDRMTTRLTAFIIVLALKTSCEEASRVLNRLGIQICGDTVIRILVRAAQEQPPQCGSFIGVDDWAYKKGNSYGTLICDGETHAPIALLAGRDGSALKEWLKHNQQVRMVTRDRAGAFAKAISEALPAAMQIADRFHLFQNFSKAIDESLEAILPNRVVIEQDAKEQISPQDQAAASQAQDLSCEKKICTSGPSGPASSKRRRREASGANPTGTGTSSGRNEHS